MQTTSDLTKAPPHLIEGAQFWPDAYGRSLTFSALAVAAARESRFTEKVNLA